MKLNRKTFEIFTLFLMLLALVGCKDEFFDVNDNPNNPSTSTPKLTLPVAQQQLAEMHGTSLTYLGQFMMYNWATPSNWSANQDFARYNITTNFYSNVFEASYAGALKDLTYIMNYEDPNGVIDYTIYKGIATILKAYQYQVLVDLYGDVPYSEANLRGANPTPKYDDAQEIYKDNIAKLTEVITLLDNAPATAENPGSQDVMFGGNMTRWKEFANTLKLRYLIRLSNTNQDSYIQQGIQQIEANGYGYIKDDVTVNPGYADNVGKLSPFYGYFRQASTGTQTDRGDFTVATDYTIDLLDRNNDPRLYSLYAEAADGGYKGVWQDEILPGQGYTSNDLSKVGPGLIKTPDQDQPLMLLSEALFLQAEAAWRGWISGSAETYYNRAIEESFIYLEVGETEAESVTAAQEYYAQAIPNVNYAGSANKLQAIITQKWIALNGTNSIESWIEYNRTGYPSGLPLPESTTQANRPVRLLYPSSEVARNANNVPKQTVNDAFNTKLFYQK